MRIEALRPNLYLIALKQEMRGFENMISSWLFRGRFRFLVDVGPSASIGILLESLRRLEVERLDFVFLTHIHLDHAGGIGTLVKHFPEAKVICHPLAVKHLIDPQRLWEGSKRVLGELALQYGEIEPLRRETILSSSDFNLEEFRLVETPGHASHHLSLIYEGYLFSGEAGGVFRDLGDKIYLRPAAPPGFLWEKAIRSIDKLLEFGNQHICYAHFGLHPNAGEMLRRHRDQLHLWREVVIDQLKEGEERGRLDRCIKILLERDPLFQNFLELDEEEKETEFYFVRNSLRGLIENFTV